MLDDAYDLGGKLGRGCFATVFKATRRVDNRSVAVKIIEKKRLDEETAILLENELTILRAVSQHPGIVTLLDHIETVTHMYFVLDYVEGGPLLDRIVSRGSFSENDARMLMRTILLTLQFLSQLGCVHRDIKPENILVDNYSRAWPVKLTDFGLSAKMQPNELLHDALGTPLFIAPEVLKGSGYDCSCDMWSLGVVLYIVLCGYPPFPWNESPKHLVRAVVNGQYTFPEREWKHVSANAKDLVRVMLEVDPNKRITATEALSHPWIAVAQSTTELPNRNLKEFNARRKLKASVVAVRTTVDFMRLINAKKRLQRQAVDSEELVRDVEKSRALIRRLGIGDNGKSIYGNEEEKKNGNNSGNGDEKLHKCRRSLVLPTGTLDGALSDVSDEASLLDGWSMVDPGRSVDLEGVEASHVESKAKAILAEVETGESCLDDGGNPFLVCAPSEVADVSRRKRTLAPLDFGIIGL